jgi:FixJ family two-component response regulator
MSQASDEFPVVHVVAANWLRLGLDSLLRSIALTARTHGSVQQFLDTDRLDEPGCIVLDVRLPDTSRLDFREELASLGIRLPVVLMTRRGDIPMSVRATKAGAVDFLPKPFRDQDMIDANTAAIDRDRLRQAGENHAVAVVDRSQPIRRANGRSRYR